MRLLLEGNTHMPLMVMWQGPVGRGGGAGRGGRGRRGGDAAPGETPAAPPAAPAQAPPQGASAAPAGPAMIQMHLSEYKVVNGIKLPHVITRGFEGQTQEELEIKSYKINPNFKSNTFVQGK